MVIYIHIPFCVRKCFYCDFLSGPADENTMDRYVKALKNEIKYYSYKYGTKEKVTSIFFGGGTPSILKGIYIEEIINELKNGFDIEETAEITVECNPGTIDRDKLMTYKRAGINRLSIGLQSANDEELKSIGRIHTYEEFLAGYKTAREVGFSNINIDLMSGLPYQTLNSYKENLLKVLELQPEHISAYSLILEEGTCLCDKIEELERSCKETGLPDEDTEREMYYLTKSILKEKGYERYEISNYAREGYECRHNKAYWTRQNYIGMGLGASSCMGDIRTKNICNLEQYISKLSIETDCIDEEETYELTNEEKMAEFMFLGLRLMEGVSKYGFNKEFNKKYENIYGSITEKLVNKGLLQDADGMVKLTELGIDVSNTVMAEFV